MIGKKMFGSPKDIFEEQLNDIFIHSSEDKSNSVLKALSLLLQLPDSNRDLTDLYNLLGVENFVAVLSLFENRTISFPSKDVVKDLIMTSLFYYYREVEGLSWSEIRKRVPFEFSSISYSSKIKKLNSSLLEKLHEALTGDYNE